MADGSTTRLADKFDAGDRQALTRRPEVVDAKREADPASKLLSDD